MSPLSSKKVKETLIWTALVAATIAQYSCANSAAKTEQQAAPDPALPVFTLTTSNTTVFQEFPTALEGKINVDIRPQVDGYLDKIFVDEGAYVKAGQPLFRIDARAYNAQLNNSSAALSAARANMNKAQVEIDRLKPLVDEKVVSPIQLKTAQEEYANAKALVAQAQASTTSSQINVGYTIVKAPVSGYIGRIPFKLGSLVSKTDAQPLTVLSDVSEMYAYFSMSEPDFIAFKNKYTGNSLEEKIKNVPPVELLSADNSIYAHKGKISVVEGQFDKTVGAITFRASFPNPGSMLRTGNTGRIRLPENLNSIVLVPQESTFEIQDKVFVFAVDQNNKVSSKPIKISGQSAHYYYVSEGFQNGDKIVYNGIGNLHDDMKIAPQAFPSDSLLKARPL